MAFFAGTQPFGDDLDGEQVSLSTVSFLLMDPLCSVMFRYVPFMIYDFSMFYDVRFAVFKSSRPCRFHCDFPPFLERTLNILTLGQVFVLASDPPIMPL